MAQVILFGGGDAGGLIITPDGIRRIPPFDPAITVQLKAVGTLLRAQPTLRDTPIQKEVDAITTSLATMAAQQVETKVGQLDEGSGIICFDDDDGFVCGSTGKPPIPFPVPGQFVPA